ncbi:MAG: hypothetical protein HXS54_10105 [Theionarchaea archaeon]|nr:hypothetical protein [Theionarchaea archaeon]
MRIEMICKNKESLLRRVFAYFLLFASGVYWEFNTFPTLSVKGYIGLFHSKGDSKPIKKSITQQRLRLGTSSTGGGDDSMKQKITPPMVERTKRHIKMVLFLRKKR